jgi:hypothetical protein
MHQVAILVFSASLLWNQTAAEDSSFCQLSRYLTHPEQISVVQKGNLDSLAFELLDLMARERHTLRDSCILPDSLALLYGYRANVWNGIAALAALQRAMKWGNSHYTLQTLELAVDRLREAEALSNLAAPEDMNLLHDFNENLAELYDGAKIENRNDITTTRTPSQGRHLYRFLQKALPTIIRMLPRHSNSATPERALFCRLIFKFSLPR